MCIKDISRNSSVRYSPEWEHAYDTRPDGFLATMTLPEYVEYVCRINGEPAPKPHKKVSVPVTVDGMHNGMRLVFADPTNAYPHICRKFKNFHKSRVYLDDTSLAECEKNQYCPGFSRINIVLAEPQDTVVPKRTPPPLVRDAPVSTTNMRSKMVASGVVPRDRPVTLKFGKAGSSEYSAPSSLKTQPSMQREPSPDDNDDSDLPDLVSIEPSDIQPFGKQSEPEAEKKKEKNEGGAPLPELEPLTSDVYDEPPELESMTSMRVHAAAVDAGVASSRDGIDISCAHKFCSYMDRYRKCFDPTFPRGRCLVFMIPDSDLVGRTDMKAGNGDLGSVIDNLSDSGFKTFFQRHAAPVSTRSDFDAFVEESHEQSHISLTLSDQSSSVEMLRLNGKFSVLKPREVTVECFVRHPDESNIWIAIVKSPLLPFAQ